MDYQRKVFYSRRCKILTGKGLKAIIDEMIENAIAGNCETIFDKSYSSRCITEWARKNFGVDLRLSNMDEAKVNEIEAQIKEEAKDETARDISLSLGEYLEDYSDPSTWDTAGLCKWAMSAFKVSLSPSKIKQQQPEDIEEQLVSAAAEQVDKKDCSQLVEFLKDDFAVRTFAEWARAKFDVKLDIEKLKESKGAEIRTELVRTCAEKYKRREIEYPVEFAMNMIYGPEGPNIYGYEALSQWAGKKYGADLSVEDISNTKPEKLQQQLLELSEKFHNGEVEKELDAKASQLDAAELIAWGNERFDASLALDETDEEPQLRGTLGETAREFLRSELSDLEKYVLLQVYDGAWKDHLYAMDHLKDSIWMRSMAEKDPKIEYKREGHRMFHEMLGTIEDRVTDVIFKVRLDPGARARSVWNVSQTAHDEVGQFAMAERQRAAAQAPQGEQKVKQIRMDTPKVGRNDPCPCGSGKKYKKCCGANA
jgi:preprotein translocase subunit SecA